LSGWLAALDRTATTPEAYRLGPILQGAGEAPAAIRRSNRFPFLGPDQWIARQFGAQLIDQSEMTGGVVFPQNRWIPTHAEASCERSVIVRPTAAGSARRRFGQQGVGGQGGDLTNHVRSDRPASILIDGEP
jgi:hypothetical protein